MAPDAHDPLLRLGLTETMEDLLKHLYKAESLGVEASQQPPSFEEFARRQREQGNWGSSKKLRKMWSEKAWETGTNRLAAALKVTPSAVSQLLSRLDRLGLVDRELYQTPRLSERGRLVATEMVRHHRLLELFLTESLGFSQEDAHPEAERLEHYISEDLEAAISRALGNPTHDPHGSPIPDAGLMMPEEGLVPLTDLAPGDRAVVRRIAGFDPLLLQHLKNSGVRTGAVVEVEALEPYGAGYILGVQGHEGNAHIAYDAAGQVGVQTLGESRSLSELGEGEAARIISLGDDAALAKRLGDLGVVVGEEISLLRRAPLGGPLDVQVGETRFSLRGRDAQRVLVTLPMS